MATVEEVIQTRLAATAGLTALVGTRIYWLHVPQETATPYVAHFEVSQITRPHAMGTDPGDVVSRWQVSVFADTPSTAKDCAEQVRAALQRYRGTVSGVTVDDVLGPENRIQLFDDAAQVCHFVQDFFVAHRES